MRRRQLLKTTAVGLSASALGAAASVPVSAQEVLLDENFEDTPAGNQPSGWIQNGNDDQMVVEAGGSKSFWLSGTAGGCWEAIAHHSLPLPNSGSVVFSGRIIPLSGEEGCHDGRGSLKLSTSAEDWSSGKSTRLFRLDTDGGVLDASGTKIAEYEPEDSHAFEIEYKRNNGSVTLSYQFNGQDVGELTRDVKSFEDDLKYLTLNSGDYSVLWDDLLVVRQSSGGGGGSEEEDLRSLSYGETRESRVDSGDPTDYGSFYYEPINFTGSAGDEISIEMESQDFEPAVWLYDPSGSRIEWANGTKEASLTATLPTDGEYTIRAWAVPAGSTGSYTISLSKTGSGGSSFSGRVVNARDQAVANATVRVYTSGDGDLVHETTANTAGEFSFTQSEAKTINDAGPVTVVLVGDRWFDAYSLTSGGFSGNDGTDWRVSNELLYGPTMADADEGPLGQVSVWRQVIDSEFQVICMEVTNTVRSGNVTNIDTSAYDLTSGNYNLSYDEDEIDIANDPYTDIDHPQEMLVASADTPGPASTNELLDAYHPERTDVPMATVGQVEYSELSTTDAEEVVNEGAGRIAGTLPVVGNILSLGDSLEWAIGDPLSTSASLGVEDPEPINPNEWDTASLVWKSDDVEYEEASVVGYFPIRLNTSGTTTIDVRGEWKFEPWTLGFGTGRGYFAEQFELEPI